MNHMVDPGARHLAGHANSREIVNHETARNVKGNLGSGTGRGVSIIMAADDDDDSLFVPDDLKGREYEKDEKR